MFAAFPGMTLRQTIAIERLASRGDMMHHETTGREFILETAAKLFSQTDYKGVSIRDIAQAC
ncbi:MAG TPA: TetR family transcriptional regulator, partial [Anaerolineae bacterium]